MPKFNLPWQEYLAELPEDYVEAIREQVILALSNNLFERDDIVSYVQQHITAEKNDILKVRSMINEQLAEITIERLFEDCRPEDATLH